MNKKIIIILIVILVLIIAIITTSIFYFDSYEKYEDQYINVELPSDMEFKINMNKSSGLIYNSSKENTTIWIYSLEPNNFLANDSYKIAKDEILNQMKQYEFNPSKHNYDGVVYKIKNTTTGNSTYAITLFYDDKNSIILLTSDNLDTLIHMANTFKLIRPYFIQILNNDTSSNIPADTSNKKPYEPESDEPYTFKDGTRVIDGVIYTPEDGVIYELHPGEPGYDKEIKKYT